MNCFLKAIVISLFSLLIAGSAYAGWLGMSSEKSGKKGEPTQTTSPIPVQDPTDKLILKRREEAHKLIAEGNQLIKKGQQQNKQDLITKGQIKKDIGGKQLEILKEQIEEKQKEDTERDNW